ncbi:MAG: hypothetical protein NTZ32_04875 [Planctomycetales bacterium]|nr:hypothetical protein [Planctomycetales bacterium]
MILSSRKSPKQKLKIKWAAMEAMGVCMSRRICVDLDNELIKLRPDWASAPD